MADKNKCVICGAKTEITAIWLIDEIESKSYFPLCESCKKEKNCFTCIFSAMWEKYWRSAYNLKPNCSKHKRKKIGTKEEHYWNHEPCSDYRKGFTSKKEWDEYHGERMYDIMKDEGYFDNPYGDEIDA